MRRSMFIVPVGLALSMLVPGACSKKAADGPLPQREAAWTAEFPAEGFWLSVISRIEPTDSSFGGTPSARFVLEADGQLRAAVGPGADETLFPPPIRRLTREQLESLWRDVVALDALNRSGQTRLANFAATDLPKASTIRLSASARSRQRAVEIKAGDAGTEAAAALVNRLAALSWLSVNPAAVGKTTPTSQERGSAGK